eukprot:GFYU01000465.1.p1 GENE.GFYU01000465.1~~GFYU01000465.1.p1  ORF type:complete len:255 (-),score=60.51 GFYU01000465.1:136-900(-)
MSPAPESDKVALSSANAFRQEAETSYRNRLVFQALLIANNVFTGYILVGEGAKALLGEENVQTPSTGTTYTQRQLLVFILSLVYMLRILYSVNVTLKRKMPNQEVVEVGLFLLGINISYALGASSNKSSIQVAHSGQLYGVDWVGVVLYIAGGIVTTSSETQRYVWKLDPSNKGKCYMYGLFKYATHINFFGDILTFTGWAMCTGSWFNAWVPLVQTAGFVFHHIPHLDSYLESRYPEFKDYAARTKKLIPFVY